jgi:membrane-bound metal-dependent hydrolase YbcI (DUF457 family)
MTSRTHDAFSFASLLTIASLYPPSTLSYSTLGISLVGNIVGGLIPDMDQASNRLWDLLPAGNIIGKFGRRLFLSHRTLSHSILGGFLLFKLLEWLLPRILNPSYVDIRIVFMSMMIGFAAHLVADSFTEDGIPLLFPFKPMLGFPPISSWRIKTGQWFEKLIVFPGIVTYIIWFAVTNKNSLINIIRLTVK